MFFILSKIAWFLLQPLAAIMLVLLVGLLLRRLSFRRTGAGFVAGAVVLLAICAFSPLGLVMTGILENRFPRPVLPAEVAGIVVLGGSFDTRVAKTRGEPELNEAADRITTAMALARRYPQAKLVFSGGAASMLEDDVPEVDSARTLFADLGLDPSRLILEDKARNTVENARYAKALVSPKPSEVWLLVTSASHMPRAAGCFRVAGFDVLPYPVDYRTPSGSAVWRPSGTTTRNLEKVHFALREFIGLAAYRTAGMTDAFFPAP